MAVEVGAGRGEAIDVLGEAVVRVVQSAVQVRHAVVGLATHVAPVGLLGQAGAERECNLGLEKPDNNWSNGDHNSVVTNSQNRPNTEYIRFLINVRIPNTEYIWFLKMIEY